MSAHVLLNLLNELGKRDKMRGLSRTINFISAVKTLQFCHYVRNVAMDGIKFPENR